MNYLNKSKEELLLELQKLRKENNTLTTKYEKETLELRQKIESLKFKEKQHRAILGSVRSGFWRYDLKGRLLEVNDEYCRMTGYSEQELLRMHVSDLEAIEDCETIAAHIQKVVKNGSDHFESRHRRKDGSVFDVRVSIQYLDIDNGQILGFHTDITGHKYKELQLTHHVGIEKVFNDISYQFVRSNYLETEESINTALMKIGRFTEVDQVYIFQLQDNGTSMCILHEWSNEGVESHVKHFQQLPVADYPWFMEKLNSHEVIQFNNVLDLPEQAKAERKLLQEQDIASILAIPMFSEGELTGFIGFDSVKSQKAWIDTDVKLLNTLSDLISGEISRTKRMHQLIDAKRKAKENENKFKKLSDLTFEGILIHKSGIAIDMNKSFRKLIGYTRSEVIGKNIIDLVIPEKYHPKFYSKILMSHALPYEIEIVNKDGELIPVEFESKYIGDSTNGDSTRVVAVRDMRERIKAEKELKILTAAVEQSANAIVITDIKGNIEYINPRFSEITGYSAQEAHGINQGILNADLYLDERYHEMLQTVFAGKPWKGLFNKKKKNGELFWEQITVTPIKNEKSEIINFLAIIEDVTALQENEQKLKQQNIELLKAKEKAEESDRLKSAFLANMSHEIRTPMNGILGFTNLLLEPDLTSEEKDEFINIVHQSGRRLLDTVTDIIEISKIEAGVVHVNNRKTDVNERIAELVSFFNPEARNKGLKLIIDELLPASTKDITTDRCKLDSILSNLIKNAIKYTESGSINIGCRNNGETIECYIKDTGIGIQADKQKAIFDRFVQADISEKRIFEGSGLGLAITKSYIEMLDGDIWVDSEKGSGSTFYFSLPAKNTIDQPLNRLTYPQIIKRSPIIMV